MSEPNQPATPDRLTGLLEDGPHEEIVTCLNRLGTAAAETRKQALRAARDVAAERPGRFDGLASPLASFLTDEDRAVRLTTAKLFVTLARTEPTVTLPVVDALTDRLADDEEFYYVRARCAEALGYIAVDAPETVADPELLADLRLGLEFDEPEVREKLAKALAWVALGDPDRLRHQTDSLAAHLDDETDLVRYHLCTALVVVGCEHPEKVANVTDELRERLTDENPYVRGRAAEACGLLAGSDVELEMTPDFDAIETAEPPSFLSDRLRYLRTQVAETPSGQRPADVGSIESVREGTEAVVEEMLSAADGACPHCGLDLPEGGPPMCPRCGSPRE